MPGAKGSGAVRSPSSTRSSLGASSTIISGTSEGSLVVVRLKDVALGAASAVCEVVAVVVVGGVCTT